MYDAGTLGGMYNTLEPGNHCIYRSRCGMETDYSCFFARFQTKRAQQRTFRGLKIGPEIHYGPYRKKEAVSLFQIIFTEYRNIP